MKRKPFFVAALVLGLLVGGGYAAYHLGMRRGMNMTASDADMDSIAAGEAATRRHLQQGLRAGQVDPANGRSILYYHDPMVPGQRFEVPGKSPFMDMMLVPVYGGATADSGGVSVSPRMQQSLGLRTAKVESGTLRAEFAAVGAIAYDERAQVALQARAEGYVAKLHARATLDRVSKGQVLLELFVPQWVAVQEEFLALRRHADTPLLDAARQRMRLAGMSEVQIAAVERSGVVRPQLAVLAPITGVVNELAVREGMAVAPGAPLMRIQALDTVWALAEIPESQAARVRSGLAVEGRSAAWPNEVFRGTVETLLPQVDVATRTLKARVQLANPAARLAPGMFVSLRFEEDAPAVSLLVPSEAVIHTGKRAVVLLAQAGGRFTVAEVEVGREAAGQTEIRRGLGAGQQVVLSGQFLIDSEASLRGVEVRLNADTGNTKAP